jgi:hypothetical protein
MWYSGLGVGATREALDACGRLAAVLTSLADWHGVSAKAPREDWSGPHRATFDERFHAIQVGLIDASVWLSSVRVALDAHLVDAVVADRAATLHLAEVNDR